MGLRGSKVKSALTARAVLPMYFDFPTGHRLVASWAAKEVVVLPTKGFYFKDKALIFLVREIRNDGRKGGGAGNRHGGKERNILLLG